MNSFPLFLFISFIIFIMARYISSVAVVLSPKTVKDVGSMKSFVISLDAFSGPTFLQAVRFVSNHPLIKGLLPNYHIVSLTLNYSEL